MKRMVSRIANRLNQDKDLAHYNEVKKKLARVPRFTSGRVSVFGWDLEYVDAPSFISSIDALVCKHWNDFRADNDRPYILDCGANIGVSVLNYKRQFPNARIIAFEPDPHFVPVLRRNLDRNSASDVQIVEAAVWICDGEADFFCEGADGSKLTAVGGPSAGAVLVKTVDLRRFMSIPIDLIKMDIEGAEHEVILGIADRLGLVKNMIIECHIDNKRIQLFSGLLSALASAGFIVSINSYGAWRDLIQQPPKLPNEFDQYILVAAWRGGPT